PLSQEVPCRSARPRGPKVRLQRQLTAARPLASPERDTMSCPISARLALGAAIVLAAAAPASAQKGGGHHGVMTPIVVHAPAPHPPFFMPPPPPPGGFSFVGPAVVRLRGGGFGGYGGYGGYGGFGGGYGALRGGVYDPAYNSGFGPPIGASPI